MKFPLLHSIISWFQVPKIHTDLLWDLTILFGSIGLIYFTGIFITKYRISQRRQLIKDRKSEFAPMISNFLFFQQETDTEDREDYIRMKIQIRELLKEKVNREVLTEILMDLRMDVSGSAREKLYRLFQDLGLHQDAYEKLKSWKWERISQGILELKEMQVVDAHSTLRKFINHRRSVIRKQAQLGTVSLKTEGINYFLDTAKYRISEWQQLKLLDIIHQFEDYNPPRFKQWLTSNNRDVVLFSLRLIKFYKQNDCADALINLLYHKDQDVKTAAVGCIKEFGFTEAIPVIKQTFRKANTDLKLALLNTIGELGGLEDVDFVKAVLERDRNFMVTNKAKSILNILKPGSILPVKGDTGTTALLESLEDNIHTTPEPLEDTVEQELSLAPVEVPENELPEVVESKELTEKTVEEKPISELIAPGSEINKILVSYTAVYAPSNLEEFKVPAALLPEDCELVWADDQMDESLFEYCTVEELKDILKLDKQDSSTLHEDFIPQVIEEVAIEESTAQWKAWLEELEVVFEEVLESPIGSKPTESFEMAENLQNPDTLKTEFIPWVIDENETVFMEDSEGETEAISGFIQKELDFEPVFTPTEEEDSGTPEEIQSLLELIFEPDASEAPTDDREYKSAMPPESQWHSIFEVPYKQYDNQARIILIQEIAHVGDIKEYFFLKSLLADQNPAIKAAAIKAISLLRERLLNELQTTDTWEVIPKNSTDTISMDKEGQFTTNSEELLCFEPVFSQQEYWIGLLREDELSLSGESEVTSGLGNRWKSFQEMLKSMLYG